MSIYAKKETSSQEADAQQKKERKINTISKKEFFDKVNKDYQKIRHNTWKRRPGAQAIGDAEYLE